jgi:hypothetical protein
MVPQNGEDSYCHSFCDTAGIIGVFDGCGGAGARKHAFYSDKTEAYMASRLCAGVFYDRFRECYPAPLPPDQFVSERLVPSITECLREFQPPKEEGAFEVRGSMVRTLPTTAAAALIQSVDGGLQLISPIWAGDSRVYVLDHQGLAQLTVDDTSVPDPMENLYNDGILRNVLCSDRPVKLHCRSVRMDHPFLAIAATDGCFGYFSTPMEFEGVILGTLVASESLDQWEKAMADAIGAVAGDDHTMCIAGYGYKDFQQLKASLLQRFKGMEERYLAPLQQIPLENREARMELWKQYRMDYFRYIKDGLS